jgi:hypothetical protein
MSEEKEMKSLKRWQVCLLLAPATGQLHLLLDDDDDDTHFHEYIYFLAKLRFNK